MTDQEERNEELEDKINSLKRTLDLYGDDHRKANGRIKALEDAVEKLTLKKGSW